MKRSKAVDAIEKLLDITYGKEGSDIANRSPAEAILDVLEDYIGMQPPHYSTIENGRRGFPIADWEPEEESCQFCEKFCGNEHCHTRNS